MADVQPTIQGQQLAQMGNTLSNINNAPPANIPTSQLQPAANAATNAANAQAAAAPQFATDVQNQYNQQLVQPLVNQYGNLDQLFQLYQHDNQLAQKYGTITGGTGSTNAYQDPNLVGGSQAAGQGMQTGNQADINSILGMTAPGLQQMNIQAPQAQSNQNNPYLGSSSDIIKNVLNMVQNPNITTSQMAQPLNTGSELASLLQSLIGSEQNLSTQSAQKVIDVQQGRNNIMQNLANYLTGQINTNQTSGLGGNPAGSSKEAAYAIESAKAELLKTNPKASENDLFNYINQNQGLWKQQGINVDEVWRTFHSMFGGTKDALLAGGKAPKLVEIKDKKTGQTIGAKDANTGQMVWGKDVSADSGGLVGQISDWLGSLSQDSSLTPTQSAQAQGGEWSIVK